MKREQIETINRINERLYEHCDKHGHSFHGEPQPIMVCENCRLVIEIPELVEEGRKK